jgi:hypothetical protein
VTKKSEPPISAITPAMGFYYHMGVAIATWAQIDEELFNICREILRVPLKHVAIIYRPSATLAAHVALVNDLVQTLFTDHKEVNAKNWNALKKTISDQMAVRNQLAHNATTPVVVTDGHEIIRHYFTTAQSTAQKSLKPSKDQGLQIQDIINHQELVGRLFHKLVVFREHTLPKLLEQWQGQ